MGTEDRVCLKIIDVAVPADCRVNSKRAMRKVEVILVVLGALQFGGNLNRSRQHIGRRIRPGHVQRKRHYLELQEWLYSH